jgi:hypothetical protein
MLIWTGFTSLYAIRVQAKGPELDLRYLVVCDSFGFILPFWKVRKI